MYRRDFWTLWEMARVGCFERTASKHVYYLGWNRSPAQVGCMRQVLRPGALGRPRGIGWRRRWEGESGWGIHVNPWLIHVNVWQKPLQCCKIISLQLIKKKRKLLWLFLFLEWLWLEFCIPINNLKREFCRDHTVKNWPVCFKPGKMSMHRDTKRLTSYISKYPRIQRSLAL